MMSFLKQFSASTLLLAWCVCHAQQAPLLASHCKNGEFAYLNANMSEPHYPRYETDLERRTKPGTVFRKTGKVLSICSDRPTPPFTSLTYRFGVIGNVELERVANKYSPFNGFERGGSPHAGEDILFFKVGQYTYCVSEATGQGSGISLTVLKGGQEVLSLFSGNNRGTDYETGLLELSFGSNKSPAIRATSLKNEFQTPCNGKRLILP